MNKKNITNTAFTLIELIIVVVLIGILVSLAMPNYLRKAEQARDQEPKVCLKLIQAAEKTFFMKHNGYYGCGDGFCNASINEALNLNLPINQATANWEYAITLDVNANNFVAIATRHNGPNQRQWRINKDSEPSLVRAMQLP